MADLAEEIGALRRFLFATHQNECRLDPVQPWLLRHDVPRPTCREQWAALGLEPSPVETSA